MSNKQDNLLDELESHLATLEEHARAFPTMDYNDRMRTSYAAIYSLWCFFKRAENAIILKSLLASRRSKEICLGILARIFAVLSLIYVPYTKSNEKLQGWASETRNEVGDCLKKYAWH